MTLGWLPLSVVRMALLSEWSPGGEQVLLALGEGNKLSSHTLPPRSYRLPGRCASQASGAAPVSLLGSGSPLLRPEAWLSPGLMAVAGREVPEGRGLQARDVPS